MKLNTIARYDVNGVQFLDGDIIAEGKRKEYIWGGQAIILSRPLAIIRIKEVSNSIINIIPYDIVQIRSGIVQLTDKASDMLKTSDRCFDIDKMLIDFTRLSDLSKSHMLEEFWNNVERIGNIYEMDI